MAPWLGLGIAATVGFVVSVASALRTRDSGGVVVWALLAAACAVVGWFSFGFAFWDPGPDF